MSNVAYADFSKQQRQERPTVADLDNGYTRIADEILECTMASGLSETELCIIMAVWRKTYGFNKKVDWISNEQLETMIRKHHTHCSTAKNLLINKKVLIQQGRKVGINTKLSEWETKNNGFCKTLAKPAKKTLAEPAIKTKQKLLNTIDTITKENKDNKNTMSEEVRSTDGKSNSEPAKQDSFIEPFEKIFWIAGMRKVGKDKCKTAFKSKFKEWRKETGGSIDEFAKFLADDIQCRLRTQQFGFDKMHPTTYLNGSRWTDEKPELPQSTAQQSSITVSKNGLVFY